MKIEKITIEGMNNSRHREYWMSDGEFTYLSGLNGSGKSTILQAIQFALLGYIPETGKTKEAIFSHCNGFARNQNGEPVMSVTLDFDGGEQVIRQMWKSGSKIESACTTTPSGLDTAKLIGKTALPIFDFSEFINMSANKMKDYFISIFPALLGSDGISVATELHKATEGMTLTDNVSKWMLANLPDVCYPATVEGVRALCSRYKEDVSGTKADIDRLTKTIQSLVYYDDCDMDDSADSLKCQIDEIQEMIDRLRAAKAAMNLNAIIEADCEKQKVLLLHDGEEDELPCRIEYLRSSIKLHQDTIQAKSDEIREYELRIKEIQRILDSDAVCPFTNSQCSAIAENFTDLKTESAQLTEYIRSHGEKMRELSVRLGQMQGELSGINSRISEAHAAEQKIRERMTELLPVDPAYTGGGIVGIDKRIAELSEKIQELTEKRAHLIANQRYESLVDDLTAEKVESDQKLEILKAWVKITDVNGLQTRLADAPFKELEKSMDKTLTSVYGESAVAVFDTAGGANKFSFGMSRNGSYVRYSSLSSGEKCVFTLALLIALTEYTESDFKIIMIDDFFDHLDDNAAELCFQTLSNTKGVQMILAGVKRCNWSRNCINVGEEYET